MKNHKPLIDLAKWVAITFVTLSLLALGMELIK